MNQGVYPFHAGTPETQRHVQYACLELLLSFVGNMEDRASNPVSTVLVPHLSTQLWIRSLCWIPGLR